MSSSQCLAPRCPIVIFILQALCTSDWNIRSVWIILVHIALLWPILRHRKKSLYVFANLQPVSAPQPLRGSQSVNSKTTSATGTRHKASQQVPVVVSNSGSDSDGVHDAVIGEL